MTWEELYNHFRTGDHVHATVGKNRKNWVKVARASEGYRQLWLDVESGEELSSYSLERILVGATDIQAHRIDS